MFYYNGKLKIKCLYKNGLLEGKYFEYYETGIPKITADMHEGKINGQYFQMNQRGGIEISCYIKNNKLHGLYRDYHPNGKQKTEGFYKEGKQHGTIIEYDIEEKIIKISDFYEGKLCKCEEYDKYGVCSLTIFSNEKIVFVMNFSNLNFQERRIVFETFNIHKLRQP